MTKEQTDVAKQLEDESTALSDLIESLDHHEIEALAIVSIVEHRRRLKSAEAAYHAWRAINESESAEAHKLKAEYMRAALDNYAQMTVVAILVDRLGRVPSMPGDDEQAAQPLK